MCSAGSFSVTEQDMMNQARHESSGVKLEVNERWVPLPAPEP